MKKCPALEERRRIADSNPLACCIYLSKVLELFIYDMLGSGTTRKRLRKDGGAFGGIEAQNRRTLYARIVVHLKENLGTSELFAKMDKSKKFTEKSIHSLIPSSKRLRKPTVLMLF